MKQVDVYKKLWHELNKMPFGLPQNRNGLEIKILKHLFSREQAEIALFLNVLPEPLQKIYKRISKNGMRISVDELSAKLDDMTRKGLILRYTKNDINFYSYALLAVGMYEFQVDRLNKEFYRDCEQYLEETFADEFYRGSMPQIRPVPVGESLSGETSVALYDDVYATMMGLSGDFAVVNCVCRQGKDLVGEPCTRTDLRETCVVFPGAANNYFNMGIGRKIDRAEAVAIVRKAEQDGLVLQMGNAQKNPMVVCCCCGDCCGSLLMAKKFPKPSEIVSSNYYASVETGACIVCGKCINRCHMDALHIRNKEIVVDRDRCIGCGACVPVCTVKAVKLVKKKTGYVPPLKTGDYYKKVLLKKAGLLGCIKIIIRILLRKKI